MTEEIIQKKQYWVEFISFSKKHCNYTDEDLAEHIVKMVEKAINYTHSCTELKTVKQGENLILDNKFDVEVITPESSVLIKHKDKDRLIWVDKQRLKRKQFLITYNELEYEF